jgi:hypothetical protein
MGARPKRFFASNTSSRHFERGLLWSLEEMLPGKIYAMLSRILQKGLLMLRWDTVTPLANAADRNLADDGKVLKSSKAFENILHNLIALT